jgi:5S rRNA maturation endonuclease (ribonuclease M5)
MRRLLHKAHSSPLRRDDNPSFTVFFSNKDDKTLLWHDFATGESGDVFKLYMLMTGMTYRQCVEYLCGTSQLARKPFALGALRAHIKEYHRIEMERTPLPIKETEWCDKTYKYWKGYGIDLMTLEKYNVKPLLSGGGMEAIWDDNINPMYAYHIGDGIKIYAPLADKANKWRSNTRRNDVQGWAQMDNKANHVIVTKSLKDVMVLDVLGYNAIAVQSENTMLTPWHMKYLAGMRSHIIVFFDNDAAGRKGAKKQVDELAKYVNTNYLHIIELNAKAFDTEHKDISELAADSNTEEGCMDTAEWWMRSQMDVLGIKI